jgi:hypothetical protein
VHYQPMSNSSDFWMSACQAAVYVRPLPTKLYYLLSTCYIIVSQNASAASCILRLIVSELSLS